MGNNSNPSVILLADDDPDDCDMMREALERNSLAIDLYTVADGEQLMEFLRHCGRYARPVPSPVPGIILVDLNMPKMDGREALAEIKKDALLRRIPVVVMTTSTAVPDIARTYDLGGNSFVSKPVTLTALVEVMEDLVRYWFQVVQLPDVSVGNYHA